MKPAVCCMSRCQGTGQTPAGLLNVDVLTTWIRSMAGEDNEECRAGGVAERTLAVCRQILAMPAFRAQGADW
jgi:hypothetical protein